MGDAFSEHHPPGQAKPVKPPDYTPASAKALTLSFIATILVEPAFLTLYRKYVPPPCLIMDQARFLDLGLIS